MIPTKNLLKQLGFKDILTNSNPPIYKEPILKFDCGNMTLNVGTSINRYLTEVLTCYGIYKDERIIKELDFEIPVEIESYEQAIALLAFQIGKKLEGKNMPDWYHEGLLLEDRLPWKKEQIEYLNRPLAKVDYDYFKLLIRKMIDLAVSSSIDDITTIFFDGDILHITCSDTKLIAPASGISWKETISIKTKLLYHLPKRIQKQSGTISLWKNVLFFNNLGLSFEQ